MATTRLDPVEASQEKEHLQQRGALIGDHVIRVLGLPTGLHAVQVRLLWEDHYRVNVLIGREVTSTRVAHSFFLVTDPCGHVITSTPPITRLY